MVFKEDTIKDVLDRLGNLNGRDMILIVWIGETVKGEPIARAIRLVLPRQLNNVLCRNIIFAIEKVTTILALVDDHKNVFEVTLSQKLAKNSGKREKHE